MFVFLRHLRTDFRSARPSADPLLTAAQILLYILLAGVVLAMVMSIVGLLSTFATQGETLIRSDDGKAWTPVIGIVLGLFALGMIFHAVLDVLAIIRSVGNGAPFTSDNATRLEAVAGNILGLQILALIARSAGTPIGGDINGFEIGADLSPGGIAVVLLLFILARVFRAGTEMHDDLDGTV